MIQLGLTIIKLTPRGFVVTNVDTCHTFNIWNFINFDNIFLKKNLEHCKALRGTVPPTPKLACFVLSKLSTPF